MKAFCTHALNGLDSRVCCWIDPTFVSDGQKKLPQRFVHVFSHFHHLVLLSLMLIPFLYLLMLHSISRTMTKISLVLQYFNHVKYAFEKWLPFMMWPSNTHLWCNIYLSFFFFFITQKIYMYEWWICHNFAINVIIVILLVGILFIFILEMINTTQQPNSNWHLLINDMDNTIKCSMYFIIQWIESI